MSGSLERARGTQISRHSLKKYLEDQGPSTVEQLVAVSSLTSDGVTVERMLRELAEHPKLFLPQPDGRWSAAPQQDRVVVPRNHDYAPPKRKKRPARTQPKQRRSPPAEPLVIKSGKLSSITLPAQATEVAGDIVSTIDVIPKSHSEVVRAAKESIAARTPVEVFQTGDDQQVAFRGTRQLLGTRSTVDSKVRLVVGPATDDEATARELPSAQARELQASAPSELVRYEPESIVYPALPPAPLPVVSAAESMPARLPAAPEITTGLKDLLRMIKVGDAGVGALDDWLIQNLGALDADQRQRHGVMIARAKGLTEAERLPRARELIDPESLAIKHCGPVLLELGASFDETSELAEWAYPMIERALADGTSDPRLLQRCARIAWQACYPTVALQLAKDAMEQGCELTADDATLIADAAAFEDDAELLDQLWLIAIDRLSDVRPTKMSGTWVSALTNLEAYLCKLGSIDLERRAMVIDLYIERNQADLAMELIDRTVFDDTFSFSDRLQMVSLAEPCQRRADLEEAATLLNGLIEVEWAVATFGLLSRAIDQLRDLEVSGGFSGRHSEALALRLRGVPGARDSIADPPELVEPDLAGNTIVIVGGQRSGRQRIKERLEARGAKVKQIPPSWEGHLDTGQIKQTCDGAQLVVEMTREMKHDSSNALDTIPDISNRRMRVWGGPSAVVREVLNRLAVPSAA